MMGHTHAPFAGQMPGEKCPKHACIHPTKPLTLCRQKPRQLAGKRHLPLYTSHTLKPQIKQELQNHICRRSVWDAGDESCMKHTPGRHSERQAPLQVRTRRIATASQRNNRHSRQDKLAAARVWYVQNQHKSTSKPSRLTLQYWSKSNTHTHAQTHTRTNETPRRKRDIHTARPSTPALLVRVASQKRASQKQSTSCLQQQAAAQGFITAATLEAPDQTGSCA